MEHIHCIIFGYINILINYKSQKLFLSNLIKKKNIYIYIYKLRKSLSNLGDDSEKTTENSKRSPCNKHPNLYLKFNILPSLTFELKMSTVIKKKSHIINLHDIYCF